MADTIHFGVNSGAQVATGQSLILGVGHSSNDYEGFGNSAIILDVGTRLDIGEDLIIGDYGSRSTLTVSDAALVAVEGDLIISANSSAEDNYLQLNDGFLAWKGERFDAVSDLLDEGKIRVWNTGSNSWEDALMSEYFHLYYFATEAAAFDYTGYSDLAGYTILGTTAIPETCTFALVLSLCATGLLLRSKRKQCR